MNAIDNRHNPSSRNRSGSWRHIALASVLTLGMTASASLSASAQNDDYNGSGRYDESTPASQNTYSDGADPALATTPGANASAGDPNSDPAAVAADAANSGPVRMARFTVVSGDVTWRGGTEGDWTTGVDNMPLRQGAQVWVSNGGRAEIQFDDGSRLRLDSNTLVTLQTLYSDTKGEYTEITLNDGQVALRTTNQYSFYQVNTPLCSVKSAGPSKFRVGAGLGVQVAVRQGTATVQGTADHARLHNGDYIDLADVSSSYNIVDLPVADAWDDYNTQRDAEIDSLSTRPTAQHLPPNISAAAGDLDTYGTWRDDPQYGWVWVPNHTDAEWRPYYAGHWTYVEPFGWTWVSSEAWGWAPYHYGTWVHAGWGWSWVPGPREQYWSPGVVAFYQNGADVAWCPLAPREVHYPATISIGFRSASWSAYFSVGGAAVYYPGERNVCEPRPWAPTYLNHVTYVRNVTNVTNVTVVNVNHNTIINNRFVASNARYGGGVSTTALGFGGGRGGEHYVPVERGDAFFNRARVVGAPSHGVPLAGPPLVRPTLVSYSPNRTFRANVDVPRPVIDRTVYRAAPPAVVARTAETPPMRGQHFDDAPGSRFGHPGNFGGGRDRTTGNVSGNMTTGRPADNRVDNRGSGGNRGGLDDYLRDRNRGGADTASPNTHDRPTTSGGIFGGSRNGDSDRYNGDRSRTNTTPSASTTTGGATTPSTGSNRASYGGFGSNSNNTGGRVFRGGSASDAAEDRRNTPTYGHSPVERTGDDRTRSGSSDSSSRSSYRPLRDLFSRNRGDSGSRDSGSRNSGSRDSSSRDSSSKDSSKDSSSHGSDRTHDTGGRGDR